MSGVILGYSVLPKVLPDKNKCSAGQEILGNCVRPLPWPGNKCLTDFLTYFISRKADFDLHPPQ